MNQATLAEKVGVSTKTIRRWIKYFDLDCKKNDHGHYIFDETDYLFFCEIRDQIRNGIPKDELNLKPRRRGIVREVKEVSATIEQPTFQDQLAEIMKRLERNERKLDEKASEVVSYQLLQQRKEIEELQQKITNLEVYIEVLEKERANERMKEAARVIEAPDTPRAKRKKLWNSFFKVRHPEPQN